MTELETTTETTGNVVVEVATQVAKDVVITAAGVVVGLGLLAVSTKIVNKLADRKLAKATEPDES